METTRSPETSVPITAKWRNIPEDGILRGRRLQNLKSYILLLLIFNINKLAISSHMKL
jgi:hypothetical protein